MPKIKKKKRKGRRFHRGDYTCNKTGMTYSFRSGWEQKMMQYLDSSSEVESWTYEQIVIEYISNIRTKKIRRYYPDFFVKYFDGHCELLEIKPKRKIEQLAVRKKAEAARAWCETRNITYKILTEIDLKILGLL